MQNKYIVTYKVAPMGRNMNFRRKKANTKREISMIPPAGICGMC